MTANAKSKTYGDANPTLDAVVAGAVERRHARLQPGDDGGADLRRRQLPDHGDAGHEPELHGHADRRRADGQPGGGDGDGQRQEKTYGDANPALDAAVVGAVNGDTLDYSLATTAVKTSGVGSYPITVTLGTNPNYTVTRRRRADGQPGGGDGDGQRQEQDLRRRQPGARCGGGRRGQRRHARLQPGDDGDENLGRRQLPDHGDARHEPELRRHAD